MDPRLCEWPVSGITQPRPVVSRNSVLLFLVIRDNPVYIKFYMNMALTVILGIAPFVALIFFNIKIYLRYSTVSRQKNHAYRNRALDPE